MSDSELSCSSGASNTLENGPTTVFIEARDLSFGSSLYLHPFFVFERNRGFTDAICTEISCTGTYISQLSGSSFTTTSELQIRIDVFK